MRVLFSTTAGSGHFGPLVPFANACLEAGHDVRVAAPVSFASAVNGAGFDHAPFADVEPHVMGAVFARLPALPPEEANNTVLAEVFGRLDAQAALPGVSDVIEEWQPEVVVREPAEFGSLVAADRAGVPQVQVAIGVGGNGALAQPIMADPLAELSAIAGLPDDRAFQTLWTTPGFTSVPAAFDEVAPDATDRSSLGEHGPIWRFRDDSSTAAAGSLPPSWGDPSAPLVYVTYGSVTATIGPLAAIYRATLDVVADLPFRVLMTTGNGVDPASRGPVPENVHVEQWWPQADVMGHAAALIGHGGFGTTMMTLAAGVPQIVVPLFAFDQYVNADRVAAVGAGMHLSGGLEAVDAIPSALDQLLTDPAYRQGAQSVAADIADLPDPADSIPILEELASR